MQFRMTSNIEFLYLTTGNVVSLLGVEQNKGCSFGL